AQSVLFALGCLFASGAKIDWGGVFPAGGRRVGLPTYAWNRERYWIEPAVLDGGRAVQSLPAVMDPPNPVDLATELGGLGAERRTGRRGKGRSGRSSGPRSLASSHSGRATSPTTNRCTSSTSTLSGRWSSATLLRGARDSSCRARSRSTTRRFASWRPSWRR